MKEIFEIFKMDKLSVEVRVRTIRKLGEALNYQYGANWTEEIVDELCNVLESE